MPSTADSEIAQLPTLTARFVGPNAKRQADVFLDLPTRVVIDSNWVRGTLVISYYEIPTR